ncbi:type II toxin-antitoxin system RelE/ParE family toxin [Franconibacter helveticus 513]|uniref:type II toxin-antitoxin system RelE/ParE family toxin n=1 Tax=Franconibacter helveticus TaxID=357240 RepID=UPI0004212F45
MTWTVLFSPDFMHWYQQQHPELQDKVIAELAKLERYGPLLGRPWADQVKGSAYINMKELRFLFSRAPYRLFYAFDPLRRAVMLCAGDKSDQKRFYETYICLADEAFSRHLYSLEKTK